ncbi:MAG: Gldg family protein [Persicimonas sp.]
MKNTLYILRRELSSYFNSAVAYIVVILFLVITGALFWLNYFQDVNVLSMRSFFAQAPLFLAFFAPAITMGLFAEEKRSGTLELLMTMPISDFEIVLGKFMAAVGLLGVVFTMTLVYPFSLSLLADAHGTSLDWGAVWAGYLGLMLLGASYAAIGLMASSWTKDQVVAILVAFSICFFLYLVDQIVAHPSGTTAQVLEYVSTSYHFGNIARGVIDTRDVVYYLSLIGVCLVVAQTSIGARRFKPNFVSGAAAAVVIGAAVFVAVALNLASSQIFTRADLTDNNLYTLSEASEQAVADLDEPIHVRAFISPDLQPPLHNLSQTVSDTLEEYAAAAEGELTYEVISPADAGQAEEAAEEAGCEKVAVGQHTEDQVSLRAVYKCVVFDRGEDRQVVDELQAGAGGTANFEYEFTRALLNLRDPQPRKIGFVSGFGGPAGGPQFLDSLQPVFEQLYGELIEVTTVDLSEEGAAIDEDVEALVVLNAEEPFSEEAIFTIDRHIQQGGSVGWFQSATAVDWELRQKMMKQQPNRRPPKLRRPIDPGLDEVFEVYGLELRRDMVLDPDNGVTAVASTERGLAQVTHPGTFIMQDIDRSLPFMRDFGVLALPAPSTIEVQPWLSEDQADGAGAVEVHRIIQTAESARRHTDLPRNFNYTSLNERVDSGEPGAWTVAATLQGDVRSYYDSHPLPEGRSEQDLVDQPSPGRILVVGSGDFFGPMPQVGFNEEMASLGGQFFINSVEWLVQDSALAQIRSKSMPRLLGEVPMDTQRSLQFVNIAAVPAVFAMLGVLMMARRRRRKEAFDRTNKD